MFQLLLMAALFLYSSVFCICRDFHGLDHSGLWIILVKRWPSANVCVCFTHHMFKVGVVPTSVHREHVLHTCLIHSDTMSVYHVSVSLCVSSRSAFACLCTRISYHVHEFHEHMLIVNRDSTSEEAPNDWFHDIRKWQGKYSGWAFVSEPSLTLITPAFSWETISEWLLVTVKTPWEWALQIEQNWNKEEHTWLQKQWQEGSMDPFSSFRSVDKITATTRPPNLYTTANNNRSSNSNNNDDKNNSTKTETIHKSTCHQPCQNPLYYCSRPPFQAPWRCQLACWCKSPAWQSQFFSILRTKGKLHQVTGHCSESRDMWDLSAGPFTFTSMILSYQKNLLWHVVGSSPGEVRVNSSLLVTPQLRWATPPWRLSNGDPIRPQAELIATELALFYGMASVLQ